jgi:hypothetical protein
LKTDLSLQFRLIYSSEQTANLEWEKMAVHWKLLQIRRHELPLIFLRQERLVLNNLP